VTGTAGRIGDQTILLPSLAPRNGCDASETLAGSPSGQQKGASPSCITQRARRGRSTTGTEPKVRTVGLRFEIQERRRDEVTALGARVNERCGAEHFQCTEGDSANDDRAVRW